MILLDDSQELESDRDEMSSHIDIDDLPRPDSYFFWAKNNYNAQKHKSSVSPLCVDDGPCRANPNPNPATLEVSETVPSLCESPVGWSIESMRRA